MRCISNTSRTVIACLYEIPFYLLLCITAVSFVYCWGIFEEPYYTRPKTWTWKPVYGTDTSYRRIVYTADTPVVNAGKIYVKDNYIYQCDTGAGIHIIDNTNPAVTKRIGFLSIPGCEEISIKGNVLYTNNYYDFIGVNIATLATPRVLSRIQNTFHPIQTMAIIAGKSLLLQAISNVRNVMRILLFSAA